MFFVFDVGGTKLRMASSFDGVNIQNFDIAHTPQEYDNALNIIKDFISKNDPSQPYNKFCFGFPGTFDLEKSRLISAPNLQLWIGRTLKSDLEQITKSSVLLYNDAELAGLGEATKGAGSGSKIVAYLTLGTGVGGVRIVNGKVDFSKSGFEPGHQIINYNFQTKESKDLENLIGGSALRMKYSTDPEKINNPAIWESVMDTLAVGLTNLIVFWSPNTVVLGGSVAHNDFIDVGRLSEKVKSMLKVFPIVPEIKKSTLGDKSAIFGGLEQFKGLV